MPDEAAYENRHTEWKKTMDREQMLNEFYTGRNENCRLIENRKGRLEYLTTLKCSHCERQ